MHGREPSAMDHAFAARSTQPINLAVALTADVAKFMWVTRDVY
jgi:hypothetical protein